MSSRSLGGCATSESQGCCAPRKKATAKGWLFALPAQWPRFDAVGALLGASVGSGFFSLGRFGGSMLGFTCCMFGFACLHFFLGGGFVLSRGSSRRCGSRRSSWGSSRSRWRLRKSTQSSDNQCGSDKRLFDHVSFSDHGDGAMGLQHADGVIRLQLPRKPT